MKLHNRFVALPAATLLTMAIAAGTVHGQQANTATQEGQSDPAGAPLTDSQILQIVRTLNDGEIKQANEAMDEAESDQAKQVAEMIIADHETSNDQLDELLDGDLELEDSQVNDTLKTQAEETHELLQDVTGSQYECAFLQQQVAQHELAVSIVESRLLPNATDAQVIQFLTAMAPKLEHHWQMAEQALGEIDGCRQTGHQ